jgi:hypothetical protein
MGLLRPRPIGIVIADTITCRILMASSKSDQCLHPWDQEWQGIDRIRAGAKSSVQENLNRL